MDMAGDFQNMTYTPVQWVYKIMQMKTARALPNGKQTTDIIYDLFRTRKFVCAAGQDSISNTFIENAVFVAANLCRGSASILL